MTDVQHDEPSLLPASYVKLHLHASLTMSIIRARLCTDKISTKIIGLPTVRPLQFVMMEILGPLQKTNDGNQLLIVVTDKYSKLTRTLSNAKKMTT